MSRFQIYKSMQLIMRVGYSFATLPEKRQTLEAILQYSADKIKQAVINESKY